MKDDFIDKLKRKTLYTRFVKSVSLLTLGLFILFSATTLFIAYGIEDAMFKEQLHQAKDKLKHNKALPANISVIESLDGLKPSSIEQLIYLELSDIDTIGEFKLDGKHFHYLVTEHGTLLLDSTNAGIINRALDDILVILLFALIPALILAFWVARIIAAHAIKPFHQLSELFVNNKAPEALDISSLEQIQEQDVKLIATELWRALDQKAKILERQLAFNQGMAHELRTPLQIMTHSVELLGHGYEELNDVMAFQRLDKSIQRMHRMCNGLLWLTSEQAFDRPLNVKQALNSSLSKLKDLINTHKIELEVKTNNDLDFIMPAEVFELITFNLLNNVVHHGHLSAGVINWQISITESAITYSNECIDKPDANRLKDRFGIGLTLVSKLAERFGLSTEIANDKTNFALSIKK